MNLTVMVADDYTDIRSLLRGWLEARSYKVVEARDGREAVSVAARERPGFILMELSMPEVDGFSAALRILRREELRDTPIVAISAYGKLGIDAQLRIDPLAVGFNDYVTKPFGPARLEELLERLVPKESSPCRMVEV